MPRNELGRLKTSGIEPDLQSSRIRRQTIKGQAAEQWRLEASGIIASRPAAVDRCCTSRRRDPTCRGRERDDVRAQNLAGQLIKQERVNETRHVPERTEAGNWGAVHGDRRVAVDGRDDVGALELLPKTNATSRPLLVT